MSRKRFCPIGYDENGHALFVEHGTDGPIRAITGPPAPGKPIPLGHGLTLADTDDEGHVYMDDVVSPGGPPQVATESYRRGWERTFN